jgi:Calx-beta domain
MNSHIRNTRHSPEQDPGPVDMVSERRVPPCSERGEKGGFMSKPSMVFARLRALTRSWISPYRHLGELGVIRHSVIGLVIGLATLSVAVLPAGIASAASTPNISAGPNVVVGEAAGSVTLPVTLSATSTSTVTVNYATPSGGGCNNLFVGKSGTLSFAPGVTSQSVTITLNNCGLSEPSYGEFMNFTFALSDATNGVIVKPSTQVDIIGDGTTAATPGLYVRNAVVDNTAGNVMVPVLLGGPEGATSTSTITVNYATANGSATAGTDYTTTSGTLTFGPGQTVQNIVVPIIDRSSAAPSRSFSVNLSSPTDAVITEGTGVVTIGASGGTASSLPNISAPSNTVVGEADGYIDLPVTLSAPGTSTVTVNYTTASGGGCDNLFQGQSGTLTFVPGQTLEAIRVPLNNCGLSGGSFSFTLSDSVNGTISNATTTVTIEGAPTITKFSPKSGPKATVVTITGTNLEGAISVTFNGKSAKISSDTATSLTVKVPAKATTGKIVVTTQGGSVTSTKNFKVT